jgi:hypothetical protein
MPGNDAAPVVLGGDIVPHDPTGSAPQQMTPAPANGAVGSITTWEQALAVLNARKKDGHVLWWQGPTPAVGNDKFSFRCAVPVPGSTSEATVYEEVLPGEGGVAAIRAVLAEIDQATHHP